MANEVTTTGDVPVYFPGPRLDKPRRKKKKKGEVTKMGEAQLAVKLVEEYGLDHSAALSLVIEGSVDETVKAIFEASEDVSEDEKVSIRKDISLYMEQKPSKKELMARFGGKEKKPFKKKDDDKNGDKKKKGDKETESGKSY